MAQSAPGSCTEVIGFSQTAQWYWGGFIQSLTTDNWQLRWRDGASIDLWANPNYEGWNDQYLSSRCGEWRPPDRVILNVSGDYNSDMMFWADRTQNAVTNVTRKYPTVRSIALQSVVGGPNGTLCTTPAGDVVRAAYNYPYINQGLRMLASDVIILGLSPQVGDCRDYQDNIGHLTGPGANAVGVAVARFWTSRPVNTPTPTATLMPSLTPTSTPTATPTRTPTPTSTSTSTPTSTPTLSPGGQVTVTFDDVTGPVPRPLSGEYPGGLINWGTRPWYLSGPWGRFTTNSISFDGSGVSTATLTLISPRRLVALDAYNGGTSGASVALACPGEVTRQVNLAPLELARVTTNWTGTCDSLTLSSSNGWHTNFKNLVLDGGSAPPTPTPAPSVTVTSTPGSSRTLTFDDLPSPYRPLNGQYPTGLIDWGTNSWYLSGPYARFTTNSVSFNGAGPLSASFTLVSPRVLRQLEIHNGGTAPSIVSVTCTGESTVSFSLAPGELGRFATGWTTPCSGTVALASSNGWDTNFKNFVID